MWVCLEGFSSVSVSRAHQGLKARLRLNRCEKCSYTGERERSTMQTKTIPYVSMVIYVAHHLLNPVKPDK